jgi:hypothetical protein
MFAGRQRVAANDCVKAIVAYISDLYMVSLLLFLRELCRLILNLVLLVGKCWQALLQSLTYRLANYDMQMCLPAEGRDQMDIEKVTNNFIILFSFIQLVNIPLGY